MGINSSWKTIRAGTDHRIIRLSFVLSLLPGDQHEHHNHAQQAGHHDAGKHNNVVIVTCDGAAVIGGNPEIMAIAGGTIGVEEFNGMLAIGQTVQVAVLQRDNGAAGLGGVILAVQKLSVHLQTGEFAEVTVGGEGEGLAAALGVAGLVTLDSSLGGYE